MKKHTTLKHAIPAVIKTMPLTKQNCWDIFCFRNNGKMAELVNCVINDEGEYKTAYISKSDLSKKKVKTYISKDNCGGYISSKVIDIENAFFCYFSLIQDDKKIIWDKKALNSCLNLIGTNKRTYFDKIESQGTDFSYERPYFNYIHQPILKNRRLDIRKKYADVIKLVIQIDELDNELFVDIQKMAIKKYGVVFRTLIRKGVVPCDIVNEIPVKLQNAKLSFSNIISFKIENSYLRKTPFILMKAGGYHEDYLSDFYMKTIYKKVKNIEQADKVLKEFASYSRIIPKLKSPWLFH